MKATSGQGIRSEVTDGEELVSRTIEKKCICRKGRIENEWGVDEECPNCTRDEVEPTTESVSSPIEVCSMCGGEGLFMNAPLLEGGKYEVCPKCSVTGEEPTPDPYEECAKEMKETLNRRESMGLETPVDELMESVKKHFPPLSLT